MTGFGASRDLVRMSRLGKPPLWLPPLCGSHLSPSGAAVAVNELCMSSVLSL